MVDSNRQSLSAWLDGEASEVETQRLLRALDEDPGTRKAWSRYQAISEVLQSKGTLSARDHLVLSHRISQSLDEEAAYDISATDWRQRLSRPITGLAVAASLVFAVAAGINLYQTGDPSSANTPVALQDSPAVQPVPAVATAPTDPREVDRFMAEDADDGELRELDEERLTLLRQHLMQHYGATRNAENYRVVSQPVRN